MARLVKHRTGPGDDRQEGGRTRAGRLAGVFGAGVVGCAVLAAIAFAGTNDREGSYTCTSSVLEFSPPLPGDAASPLRISANEPDDPCRNDKDTLLQDQEQPVRLLTAETQQRPADLTEEGESSTPPKHNDGADAKASASEIDIPLGDSGYRLRATGLQTHAWVRCHCAYPRRTFYPGLGSKSTIAAFSIVDPQGQEVASRTTMTSQVNKIDDGPGGLPFAVFVNRQQTGTQQESGRWVQRTAFEVVFESPDVPSIRVLRSRAGYEGNPCEFGA